MMDTTLINCKICEKEFDSIYEIDEGVCDECQKDFEKTFKKEKHNNEEIGDECTCFETGAEECPLHGNPC